MLLLVALIVPAVLCNNCTNFNSQAIHLQASYPFAEVFYNASQSTNKFCTYINNNGSAVFVDVYSQISLADSNAIKKTTVATMGNLPYTCKSRVDHASGCISMCNNQTIEKILIDAAVQSNNYATSALSYVEQEMAANGNPDWPITIFHMFATNCSVKYDYYLDPNYCSVVVQVNSPNFLFPFRMFLETNKVV